MEETRFQKLIQFFSKLSPGPIPEDKNVELIALLKNCWDSLNLGRSEDLDAYKLGRMEDPSWEPPLLTFIIERHGGIAMGSTRAELQRWTVDMEQRETNCLEIGYQQVMERQAPVDVRPIADELAQLIVNRSQDERLKWSIDGRVQVLTGKIFPEYEMPKQTMLRRRRRLIKALEERLAPHRWTRSLSWWDYAQP